MSVRSSRDKVHSLLGRTRRVLLPTGAGADLSDHSESPGRPRLKSRPAGSSGRGFDLSLGRPESRENPTGCLNGEFSPSVQLTPRYEPIQRQSSRLIQIADPEYLEGS